MAVIQKDEQKTQPKPFLKWVGGKGRLIAQLEALYPDDYGVFYEPFVGGGAVFFSLNPPKACINDTNDVLINAYINIRDNLKQLVKELSTIEVIFHELPTMELKSEFYYEKRTIFNNLTSQDFEKTVLLIFLNKTCFNGIYRENSKGGFNVPFGKHDKPTICDEKNLSSISKALSNTTITSQSFELAVKNAKKGDFIYFDPPYHPLNTTSSFTSYHASGFNADDQEKLRDVFTVLSKRGCKVMLSNSDTELIRSLYSDYKIHTIYAGRSINSVGHKRGKIKELVITNY